jgi:hypothetical protein
MSHVATIQIEIKDLNALEAASKELGLELVRGQTTFRKFERSRAGECDHAIRIPGDQRAYEIGVVKIKGDKPGYTLAWDSWAGGYGMVAKVGQDAGLLKQAYAGEVAVKTARAQGFRVLTSNVQADGTRVYELQR